MIFSPQQYCLDDLPGQPFISIPEIDGLLAAAASPSAGEVAAAIDASMDLKRLTLRQTAVLIGAAGGEHRRMVIEAAGRLKERVYGRRIVLFAPLYIGNSCTNNCLYCGFRAANREAVRRTLSDAEISAEVTALERTGQKRLILVYGEHPSYDAEFIAGTVRRVYATRGWQGSINRVNINAAPFDVDGFSTIREAGIGTYQIFQETYDPEVYGRFHPSGRKRDYNYRLTALDRAMQAGIDDVGLGVLLGLGDWRRETMALVRHANHLEACFGVGPHTISFPRIRNASNIDRGAMQPVDDRDFAYLVAVLRLAVPYAGLILTARETPALRDELLRCGITQIDAGTNIEIGGYSARMDAGDDASCHLQNTARGVSNDLQDLEREQFEIGDTRSLAEVASTLIAQGFMPSFCTACYRRGRTGEHFMEFSTRGFIKNYCTPNAMLSLAEYLEDYAPADIKQRGWQLIEQELADIPGNESLRQKLEAIKNGERDLFL